MRTRYALQVNKIWNGNNTTHLLTEPEQFASFVWWVDDDKTENVTERKNKRKKKKTERKIVRKFIWLQNEKRAVFTLVLLDVLNDGGLGEIRIKSFWNTLTRLAHIHCCWWRAGDQNSEYTRRKSIQQFSLLYFPFSPYFHFNLRVCLMIKHIFFSFPLSLLLSAHNSLDGSLSSPNTFFYSHSFFSSVDG